MRCTLVCVAGFIATALSLPTVNHVRHERREITPHGWTKSHKMDVDTILPMKIALKQPEIDNIHDYLMDVSHPSSEKFGQHWTAKEVAEMFAPSKDSVDAVRNWLAASGIATERVAQTQSMGWLEFKATVGEAEELLKTKYYIYKHRSGQPHIACSEYSVPADVRDHVDFITPTVHFDAPLTPPTDKNNPKSKRQSQWSSPVKRDNVVRADPSSTAAAGVPVETGVGMKIGSPKSGSLPKSGGRISEIFQQLANCSNQITPDCLRALYEFPPNFVAAPGNSFGIVEYTPQSYIPSDLDLFFANFSKRQIGERPIFDSIDGGALQTFNESFSYNGESDLDLEYGMTLVYPQKVTLYQAGDFVEGASFNNFLDAIDGSYCTFEGGDDPTQDGVYPDPLSGGYKGPENCGGFAATKVISTSYGYNEADLTPFYEMRQCAEYAKLGLQGVSVLYSSGDYGVAGNGGQCIDPVTHQYNNGTSGLFNPSFPSTCPYVTSVGATQIVPGASVTAPEEACETVIYSGGGFSNVFPLPSYQAAAVHEWFTNHPPPYGADRFNNSQMTRGYPDISANGANYVVAIDGAFSLVYGTSASTPVVGSIVTLLNEARLFEGKGSIGFLNPTLYANPAALNDITMGGNQGCGTPGFTATTGWDPVTGLGTPNFPKLLEVFAGLGKMKNWTSVA